MVPLGCTTAVEGEFVGWPAPPPEDSLSRFDKVAHCEPYLGYRSLVLGGLRRTSASAINAARGRLLAGDDEHALRHIAQADRS
jgi:hypothetical protein